MKNILVPTDFSVYSTNAFAVASSFAKQLGYGITLFTSLTPQLKKLLVYASGVSKYSKVDVQDKEIEAYVNEKLQSLADDKVFKGLKVNFKATSHEDDEKADHIVEMLNPKDYAMVVMGNQGAQGNKVTVADLVIRNCDFPVVSVKESGRKSYKVKNMLFFTDFELVDDRFVLYLKKMQKLFKSNLIIGYVNTEKEYTESTVLQSRYQEFVADHNLGKVKFEVFNAKKLESGMITMVSKLGVDLVCMGTHGRKGLTRFFKNNLAEDFINHVSIPTMVYNESNVYKDQLTSGEASYGRHAYTRGFSG